ncbi:MAG: hypothetical protein ABSD44_13600 [Terracidiphilus sp.]
MPDNPIKPDDAVKMDDAAAPDDPARVDDPAKVEPPAYHYLEDLPGGGLVDVANIHHREAKQLFVGAEAAKAEGREEEANLLLDLAIAREETAKEFDKAAKGEIGDPVVAEILDWQEDLSENYVPFTSDYVAPVDDTPPPPPKELTLKDKCLNWVAWVGGLIDR